MVYRKKITSKRLSISYDYESLNQELIEKKKIIKNLEHEKNYYYDLYHHALSSISFKITHPLRVINSYLIKAKKVKFEALNKKFIKKRTNNIVVVLPVFSGVKMTQDCIKSALPSILSFPDAKLLIINDCGPDKRMLPMLKQFKKKYPQKIDLVDNKSNQGSLKNFNIGFKRYPNEDIVILNSDTLCVPDWLKRLELEAYSDPKIGTVTPLSNSTEICSFPFFMKSNELLMNLNAQKIDSYFVSPRLNNIEAPTGIGFCQYYKRKCLDDVGYYDEVKFGKGYGEENHFCQTAIQKGWKNVITPNLFIFHYGGVSYGEEKKALLENSLKIIEQLHPNYYSDVSSFIYRDPLKNARIIRLMQMIRESKLPKVLYIVHGLGGGTFQHIQELIEASKGIFFPLILKSDFDSNFISLKFFIDDDSNDIKLNLDKDVIFLSMILQFINISSVHIHHFIGFSPHIFDFIERLNVKIIITIHDYFWLNGNATLADRDKKRTYFHRHNLNVKDVEWDSRDKGYDYKKIHNFINNADLVIFPSFDTLNRYLSFVKIKKYLKINHLEINRNINKKPLKFIKKKKYSIAVLGGISQEKGADFLEELAVFAYKSKLNFTFSIIGHSYRKLNNISNSGHYESKYLPELIKRSGVDLILFPAKWPETYSYTLSYALNSGLPIIAPNLGAFPERLSGRKNTLIYDYRANHISISKEISLFILNMEKGINIQAQKIITKVTPSNFYSKKYINLLKKVPLYEGYSDINKIFNYLNTRKKSARNFRLNYLLQFAIYVHKKIGFKLPQKLKIMMKNYLIN
jgi:GT2 family glycosyltransferase